jgi:ABC-2 type transport system ATP-binding protein
LHHVTDAKEGLAVYVENGAVAVADVVQLLNVVLIHPTSITLSRPSLDDVFLAATGRRIEGGSPVAAA